MSIIAASCRVLNPFQAIICLFALLFVVFSLSGCTQQENSTDTSEVSVGVLCTQEVQECPDGSFVARDTYNNCAFKECP